jgi:hypothetical protein
MPISPDIDDDPASRAAVSRLLGERHGKARDQPLEAQAVERAWSQGIFTGRRVSGRAGPCSSCLLRLATLDLTVRRYDTDGRRKLPKQPPAAPSAFSSAGATVSRQPASAANGSRRGRSGGPSRARSQPRQRRIQSQSSRPRTSSHPAFRPLQIPRSKPASTRFEHGAILRAASRWGGSLRRSTRTNNRRTETSRRRWI